MFFELTRPFWWELLLFFVFGLVLKPAIGRKGLIRKYRKQLLLLVLASAAFVLMENAPEIQDPRFARLQLTIIWGMVFTAFAIQSIRAKSPAAILLFTTAICLSIVYAEAMSVRIVIIVCALLLVGLFFALRRKPTRAAGDPPEPDSG